MRTRRESVEEKRTREEKSKKAREEKKRRNMFKPEKLIRSNDMHVDLSRHGKPKIHIDPADIGEPVVVKAEVKTENLEDEVGIVNEENDEWITEAEQAMITPVLSTVLLYFEENDIFKLRQVSKEWRRIVDDFIEEAVVPRPYDDKAYLEKLEIFPNQLCPLPKFRVVKYSAYNFDEEDTLEKFNGITDGQVESKLSPFVGGATVTLRNLFTGCKVLSPATKQFLEKFGVHIRRLKIQQFDDFNVVGFVNCVKMCIKHVPNLEGLKIGGVYMRESHSSKLADWKLEIYQMERFDARTLKLDQLTSLEFEYSYDRTFEGDGRKGPISHLKYLEIIFGDIMINPYYQSQLKQVSLHWSNELLCLGLCNVKELTLDKFWINGMKIEMPVEKLAIRNRRVTLCKAYFDEILRQLQHLRFLSVGNWLGFILQFGSKLPDNRIHTLEIVDFNINETLGEKFCYAFPKLRYLIIRELGNLEWNSRWNAKAIPEIKTTKADMTYDSVIWKLLPEFEMITIQFQRHLGGLLCTCKVKKGTRFQCPFENIVETRAGYQRYLERQIVTVDETKTVLWKISQEQQVQYLFDNFDHGRINDHSGILTVQRDFKKLTK